MILKKRWMFDDGDYGSDLRSGQLGWVVDRS